ncbi:protocatechuate 3,4-dioxygenase [Pseudomaricurvus alkylphenolicus]|jgi:protocatechuate 4,5-dioxygenase alpha subunit|uniref:protocatechuate 3,4-dioxygenase n=1 Tax=Pseudomaricurvus alkylphenolicus TaxID=1306991 RepID=UPI00141FB9C5|nr:protocatechuate 3,4-dioxygenase [Pseudomaricurvus alkylphenolicus]NIB38501.1 protocatechuate 3,4-dioxygenase [Pseudomaricurvus alkylphenolicus]
MSKETGHSDHIPGTFVFTGQRSRKGLNLNRFAYSLHEANNREAYLKDPEGYMDSCGLSQWEKTRILEGDWKSLIEEGGGSVYMLLKMCAVTSAGLTDLGAQMRGETQEEFLKTRNVVLRENA